MKNKTVLITGASHGIGKETARVFSKEGYRVALNYFHSEKEARSLEKELKSVGHDALAIKGDVSKSSDVKNMVKEATDFLGHIDVLINNAGVGLYKLFCETTEEEWEEIFKVNVTGAFNCCKEVLPQMVNRKNGKIINISSILGLVGGAMEVAYCASKAAIIGFTKALSKEVGPSNINVNCIAPGLIKTKMNKNLSTNDINNIRGNTPILRVGFPEDVANAALFLASNKSNFITGEVLKVDGGLII